MLSVNSGNSFSIVLDHDVNGQASLSDIQFTLKDVTGIELIPLQSISGFDPMLDQTTLVIPAINNITTQKFDARVIEAHYIGSDGTNIKSTIFYEIVGDLVKLTPMVDSFMYYPESIFIRRRIIDPLSYYDEMSEGNKALALTAAFEKLMLLKYQVDKVKVDLSEVTAEQLSGMNPKFVEALKMAQMVEANKLVESNPIKEKRRMGIISETIGESSMFFQQKNIDTVSYYPGLSDDAYPYLSQWLWKSTSNGQIWTLRRA